MAYNTGTIFDNAGRMIYGDGSDGSLTFDGTTTILGIAPVSTGGRFTYMLTRDITAESITVNSTVDVLPNGYRIYVRNKLTIQSNATINMNGGNADGVTAGTGYTNLGSLFVTSVAGAAGRTAGGAAQNGLGATAGPTSALVAITGGNGGSVTGGTTGAGGTSSLPAALSGLSGSDWTYFFKSLFTATTGKVIGSTFISPSGGPGGGGGAITAGTGTSGAGGGGGGAVLICAYELDNSGTISAKGGNGGNYTGTPTGAGGGGGGGGGWVSVVARFFTNQGTITANGGSAGAGINQVIGATNGANGTVNILRA